MSHQPERKEKVCLNCGAALYGRYCHVCGQENIVIKQGFWPMIKHFVYDVFHFDGKFFDTLKNLFFYPGLISREYIEGKRAKYLDPVRMYLFTSAIFFIIFFWMGNPGRSINIGETGFITGTQRSEITEQLSSQLKQNISDTILMKKLQLLKDTNYLIRLNSTNKVIPTDSLIIYKGIRYEMQAVPDFIRIKKTDGWVKRKFKTKINDFNKKYGDNLSEGLSRFLEIFLHKLPYLLYVSLPFFAGILRLLYIRRKQYYYSDHAVFTLYHYILSFILILFIFLFQFLQRWTGWGIFNSLVIFFFLLWMVYLYIEMKRFYRQGWAKTLIKFLLLNFLGIIVLGFLYAIFLMFSVFQI